MNGLEEKLERIEQSAFYRELSRYNGEVVSRRMEIDLKDYEWLMKQAERAEKLEKENRELNMEIGRYAGEVGEMAQTIDDEVSDLKRLAMRMCKVDE